MAPCIEIAGRKIGPGHPAFIVAEMSGNHHHDFDKAVRILRAAKDAGADAVKLQTYTADTLTIDSDQECFKIKGTIWEGETLHSLYRKACTPWEWHSRLKEVAGDLGLILFSTPFDPTAVDYLEKLDMPAYKIASFELVDLPLIEYAASKGKPILMSTGMATREEIAEAIAAARKGGARQIALLKCTSAYPAPAEEANLRMIPRLAEDFGLTVGLSDHTLGIPVAVASVALGASIIEKHFTLSRADRGVDSSFSLEPAELRDLVLAVRTAEKALGSIGYAPTSTEGESRVFRRSLFAVRDIKAGERFHAGNVRSIRPGYGLPPKHLGAVIGSAAACDIERGSPLSWDMIVR